LEEKTQGHQKVLKSHLVKFALKILLKFFGISNWGVGYIPGDAFSQIEKMENLVTPSFNASYFM